MINKQIKKDIIVEESFDYFVSLVQEAGVPVSEAFSDAFDFLIENLSGDVEDYKIDKAYSEGRTEGIIEAYEIIGLGLIEASETALEMHDSKTKDMTIACEECDCEFESDCEINNQSLESKITKKKD